MSKRLLAPLLLALGTLIPWGAAAQVPAEPTLRGRVLLGDSALGGGTVVLHRVSAASQGEIDSTRVASDGSFTLRLPTVPDPARSEVYFASVHHAGVLYFGKAVTLPIQLDSLYTIQAYDTLVAPEGGAEVTVQARNVFVETGEGGRWQVTDLFQLRNDAGRTLVAREGGVVWSHPLAEGAADAVASEADLAMGGVEALGTAVRVTGPLPPGERLLVVRYSVPDPFLVLPTPHVTEILEIMVREPAPPLEAEGLSPAAPVELEEGATFRRLAGTGLGGQVVRLTEGRAVRPPPAPWVAVILTLVLAGIGLWGVLRVRVAQPPRPIEPPSGSRKELIVEIARLDEAFAQRNAPTAEERGAYEARRGALLRRLAELG